MTTHDYRYAPIVLFVYNRPLHTQRTLLSLATNSIARQSDLIIFADGARDSADALRTTEVKECIDSLLQDCKFASVRFIQSDGHKGLALSVIQGVTEVLREFGKVIVVEDDLVVSSDFLFFMNMSLDRYANVSNVWSISGYCPPIRIPSHFDKKIFFARRASSWGYATWIDRWSKVDWAVQDYKQLRWNFSKRRRLSRAGRDLYMMLGDQIAGRIDSWAVRWIYSQVKLQGLTVYPIESLVENIGLDGSGRHSGVNPRYSIRIGQSPKEKDFLNPFLDENILKEFIDFYGKPFLITSWRIKRKIRFLNTLLNWSSRMTVNK